MMNEESEQVWKRMKVSLRRVRRRRLLVHCGASSALCLLAGLMVQRSLRESPAKPSPEIVEVEEVDRGEVSWAEDFRLAVLVFDGDGMRFELMEGERLGVREFELSLQPVVVSAGGEVW